MASSHWPFLVSFRFVSFADLSSFISFYFSGVCAHLLPFTSLLYYLPFLHSSHVYITPGPSFFPPYSLFILFTLDFIFNILLSGLFFSHDRGTLVWACFISFNMAKKKRKEGSNLKAETLKAHSTRSDLIQTCKMRNRRGNNSGGPSSAATESCKFTISLGYELLT